MKEFGFLSGELLFLPILKFYTPKPWILNIFRSYLFSSQQVCDCQPVSLTSTSNLQWTADPTSPQLEISSPNGRFWLSPFTRDVKPLFVFLFCLALQTRFVPANANSFSNLQYFTTFHEFSVLCDYLFQCISHSNLDPPPSLRTQILANELIHCGV